ncbi:MAG: hypothetical protein ABJG68_15310 [Crocinitomicaceae bacterium]
MSKIVFVFFVLLFSCSNNSAQVNSSNEPDAPEQVVLKEYLFFNEDDSRIYQCEFRGKHSVDTVISKKNRINEEFGFYPWEYDPPFFFIYTNSFLGGISIIRNDSVFFKEVEMENQLVNLKSLEIEFLFPPLVETGAIYTTKNLFGRKIEYEIIEITNLSVLDNKYEDCIHIRKTVYYEDSEEVDNAWLAKDIGLVKWQKSTGRIELLQEFIPGIKSVSETAINGKLYFNSQGKQLYESELQESHKTNSDFTTAIYDGDGLLIREDYYGTSGEMGIKFITYEYNQDQFLVKELYHYTGSMKPDAEIKSIWLNEYYYDENGLLIETKHKFDVNDMEYYKTKKFEHLKQTEVGDLRHSKRHPMLKKS